MYTLAEKLRMGLLPADIATQVEALVEHNHILQKEIDSMEKAQERPLEQVYFARQLLDDLEEGLATVKGVKQARDWFKKCCDNSMFER